MKFEIKHRYSGSVLFSLDCDSFKSCVEAAVKAKCDLSWSNLFGSNLSGSDLSWSNLFGSNLSGSDLSWSNLSGSNLSGSNLSGSNLSGSNLSWSNLSGSNLSGSNLSGSMGAELSIAMTRILPDGDLIGWKKCVNSVIVKLKIRADSKRSNAFSRKCRAEFVDVLEVIGAEEGISSYDNKTVYRVGETVRCDKWDKDFTNECSGGIHFFITRLEAENYIL